MRPCTHLWNGRRQPIVLLEEGQQLRTGPVNGHVRRLLNVLVLQHVLEQTPSAPRPLPGLVDVEVQHAGGQGLVLGAGAVQKEQVLLAHLNILKDDCIVIRSEYDPAADMKLLFSRLRHHLVTYIIRPLKLNVHKAFYIPLAVPLLIPSRRCSLCRLGDRQSVPDGCEPSQLW